MQVIRAVVTYELLTSLLVVIV